MVRRPRTNSMDHLSARVDAIESTLRELLDGFSEIKSAIVRHEATRPSSFRDTLDVAYKLLMMCVVAGGLIIGVSAWGNRPDTATSELQRKHDDDRFARNERYIERQDQRISELEKRSWVPSVKTNPDYP